MDKFATWGSLSITVVSQILCVYWWTSECSQDIFLFICTFQIFVEQGFMLLIFQLVFVGFKSESVFAEYVEVQVL